MPGEAGGSVGRSPRWSSAPPSRGRAGPRCPGILEAEGGGESVNQRSETASRPLPGAAPARPRPGPASPPSRRRRCHRRDQRRPESRSQPRLRGGGRPGDPNSAEFGRRGAAPHAQRGPAGRAGAVTVPPAAWPGPPLSPGWRPGRGPGASGTAPARDLLTARRGPWPRPRAAGGLAVPRAPGPTPFAASGLGGQRGAGRAGRGAEAEAKQYARSADVKVVLVR